eukprot:snap_masked-scaffold_2-processed-gene-20.10-mRNA-1 protein AED:0.54 eAED:0.57 QI:0/-1/0/1/-1/1/1/0/358
MNNAIHRKYLENYFSFNNESSSEQKTSTIEQLVSSHIQNQALFWLISAAKILDIQLFTIDDKAKLVELLLSSLDTEQEKVGVFLFGASPMHTGSILQTQHVLYCIFLLGDTLPQELAQNLFDTAVSFQTSKSSFSENPNIVSLTDSRFIYSNLCTIYFLLLVHSELVFDVAKLKQLNKAAESKIWSLQNFDGGFGGVPNSESHSAYTWTCVASLAVLQRINNFLDREVDVGFTVVQERTENIERLIFWLISRQTESGGFNGRQEKQPDVCYSWWVLATLEILGKTNYISGEKLKSFIIRCQDPTGGIADREENVGDVFHTFFALAALSVLDPESGYGTVDPALALPKDLLSALNIVSP